MCLATTVTLVYKQIMNDNIVKQLWQYRICQNTPNYVLVSAYNYITVCYKLFIKYCMPLMKR